MGDRLFNGTRTRRGGGSGHGFNPSWTLSPHHNLDHRALVVKIWGKPGGVKLCVRERLNIPKKKKTPPTVEQTEREKMFKGLKGIVLKLEWW